MITNVNLMQNPEDIIFDNDSRYSKEHLIQALANLGQRIGIKGDGIAYKSFNFSDILIDYEYSSNTHVGYIEYIKDDINNKVKALFGVTEKTKLTNYKIIDNTYDIDNTLNFNSELSFSIPINDIEKYSKKSLCINKDNELTFMLAGKKYGYDDNDNNNTILMYYKFNILKNKLISGYKIFHINSTDVNDYYCLLEVKEKSENVYDLNIKICGTSIFDEFVKNGIIEENDVKQLKEHFKNLFTFSTYNNDSAPFSIFKENYVNENELLNFNEYIIDNNSLISIINSSSNLYDKKTINLLYNSNKNEFLAPDNFSVIKDFFYEEYYKLNLNEELFYINEDINKLYINIFNYYNEKFYLEKRATLIKRLLLKLYEKSINYNEVIGKRLYIPLDYEFHYICNNNNELNIYYSNNIYVTYTSLDNVDLSEFWLSNNNLVLDYENLNKLKIFNFEINYNSSIENLINSISIKEIYTMPYINAYNNWSINDSDTKIKAVGKDAGNPNIIMIYNNDINNSESSYNVLNVLSNKEKILSAQYKQQWFYVNNALFDNSYDAKIECCAYIPVITKLNFEYFKDSIIFSISDLNCLKNDLYKTKYKGSYILTFWKLTDTSNDIQQFECITEASSTLDYQYALALGSTVNILNELNDKSIANLNSQDLILLKSIISNVAQETLNVNSNNWLIIKNKQSEEYNDEYANDLNMIMQYDDNISIKSDHIIHSHSNSKYLENIDNVKISNSLYPKYIRNTETIEASPKNVNVIVKKTTVVPSRYTTIKVDGNTITNIESLIEEIKETNDVEEQTVDTTYKAINVYSLSDSGTNYYEYSFNNNVPTIDYKEMFNRNFNLLNRLNIISLDNNGKMYNAYLGTSYDESNKSTLHLGSSNLNINIGTDTLINEVDKDKFVKHDTLSIDFDNIKLNANKHINLNKPIIYTYEYDNITYNVSSIKLIGPCLTTIKYTETEGYSFNNNANSLFAYYYKDGNKIFLLSINELMSKMFNINIESYDNVELSTNQINININVQNLTYYFMPFDESNNIDFINSSNNNNVIWGGGNIDIMYYEYDTNNQTGINIYVSFK